ncbi:hypothetical protein HPP92_020945 [Vanilla planifolia]|uniref:Uncharacterized protein n=2 Tax=Vanilla planifolia TaxID=51239 RepID=A0A835PYZ4_VANPL|nr:hypothetical protein HPP92_020945 [Vanilla planifolia]
MAPLGEGIKLLWDGRDFDLCFDCYNNGKFGSGMTPADFILMESVEETGVNGGSWTDQETLLLLEALELFGENWNEMAEHVATKTKAQCIMHFLQMPIEDPFLDVGEHNGMSDGKSISSLADVSEGKDADVNQSCETHLSFAVNALKGAFQAIDYTYEEERPFSFAEAGNPVMVLLRQWNLLESGLLADIVLEDPPVDTRDPLVFESVTGIGNVDGLKEDHLHSLSGSSELNNEVEDSLANAASSQSEMKQSATYHEGSQKSSPEKESSVSFHLLDSRDDTRLDDKWDDRTSQSNTMDPYDVKDPVLSTTDNSHVVIASPRQRGSMPNVVKVLDTLKVTEKNIQNCVDQSYNKESLD